LSNLGQWAAPDLASAENIEPSHIVEAISVKEAWIREDRACDSQIEVARHLKLHYSTVSRLIKSVKSKGKDRTPLLLCRTRIARRALKRTTSQDHTVYFPVTTGSLEGEGFNL